MPPVGEMGSAARTRVRFQEVSDSDSVHSNESEANSVGSEGFEIKEDPSFWKDHNVQVVIRIRPLSSYEISLQGHNKCIRQETCQTITWTGQPESRFTFDIVADEYVTQEKLFKVAGVPMVENCVAGYNSCMFAYGQTGSGKTHTMLGDIEGGTRRHSINCGMTPRVFEYMFSRIQKEKEARRDEKIRFTCKCSFLEIYNEHILDLLDPSAANLQIREDAKKGVHVENLTEFEVSSPRDVMQRLTEGADNRKVAATNMNRASSRSHSVFTCVIESKWEAQGVTHHRFARLNLVDLAGSERQKSSGAEGDRLKEATNINKSLSTLGLVIMNLVGSSKKSMHVPYRDSKLTFLLQDSLGGNSKTIIIANISPSNCCALETLSTLKFAQRAKFIRNNAIVNEDASGDVLAMRMQIQHLKKEVNRLQGLVHGGPENFGSDTFTPGSPGTLKWEGVQGSFSPLTFDKRLSQRKEYEAALVAAFRRDQEKGAALKALAAGKQAAEQLVTQRTEEVRSLKMRLRFREERIKRLEAVSSSKLSAETHLLQEREELQKEIEVLRNQVDRNPEVTRFAMENLQLKEELRRLQSFVEEGERDMLNEQITVLQDKLLEALDWKLMHEKDTEAVQGRLSLTWDSSVNEENEFLRMQAIQNQKEVDTLRKNLTFCLEAKEKLERRVDELVSQLKVQSAFDAPNEEIHNFQKSVSLSAEVNESTDDQMELKTMVDAIAAASQREAEAHETAIILAKENEELREKINVLIEDNNKLIELYEGVVASGSSNHPDNALIKHTGERDNNTADCNLDGHENINCENSYQETSNIEHLQHQLHEMHEENDKLLGLYEKAMQEKDELKKLLSSSYDVHKTEATEETKHEEKQHRIHDGVLEKQDDKKLEELLDLYEKVVQERDELRKLLSSFDVHKTEATEEAKHEEKQHCIHDGVLEKQDDKKLEELLDLYEKVVQERDELKKLLSSYDVHKTEATEEAKHEEKQHHIHDGVLEKQDDKKLEELLDLYEKVVQERDELKKLLSSYDVHKTEATEEAKHEEKQHHIHDGVLEKQDDKKLEELLDLYEKVVQERDELKKLLSSYDVHKTEATEEAKHEEKQHHIHDGVLEKQDDKKLEELLDLYEKVVQERDELKKLLSSYDVHKTEATEEAKHEEKQHHIHDGVLEKQDDKKLEELLDLYEKVVQERDEYKRSLSFAKEEIKCEEKLDRLSEEKLCLVRTKLDLLQNQLANAGKAVKYFGLLEKATFEVDELRDTIETQDQTVQLKEQELTTLRSFLPITLERKTVAENKLLALKVAVQNFSSRAQYWDQREELARAKVRSCSEPLDEKKEELRHLKIRKDEADSACTKTKLCESEIRSNIDRLKLKYQNAEAQKKETEKVLFAIDNNPDLGRATNFGKASEMLKSEEERSGILVEIKKQKEQLATVRKEIADSKKISELLGAMIRSLESGIESGTCKLKEAELKLKEVVAEKQMLAEMKEEGITTELSKILVEYQESIFESDLKEEEIKLCDEVLQLEMRNLEELRAKRLLATQNLNNLLSNSDKVEIELEEVQRSLADAKSLLVNER